jgi:hypothetical protein
MQRPRLILVRVVPGQFAIRLLQYTWGGIPFLAKEWTHMPFIPFHDLCPELAKRETRTITVPPGSPIRVPPGAYEFVALFCDEAGCDCRRATFNVLSSALRDTVAVIAWGWEDTRFYAEWLGMSDPEMAREMKGPVLNLCSPQTRYSETVLGLAQEYLLTDPAYVERVKRHYALFREQLDRPGGGSPRRTASRPDAARCPRETSRERRARRREARQRWGRSHG